MRAAVLLLGLVAAARAHDTTSRTHEEEHTLLSSPTDSVVTATVGGTTYTIPVFNPSTALTFGAPNTPLPSSHDSEHDSSEHHSPTASSKVSGSSPTASTPASSAASPSSSSAAASGSSTGSSTTTARASGSSSTTAPAQQTTGAAPGVHAEYIGALAGGLIAGLALVWWEHGKAWKWGS